VTGVQTCALPISERIILQPSVAPEHDTRAGGGQPGKAALQDGVASAARERYAILQRSLARLSSAGARIVLGGDTGLQDDPFGFAEHRELELMVEAGMSPMQAIVAATRNGADYLGMRSSGVLAPGKRASFLVLDGNPLADITNTRRIARIVLDGRVVERDSLRPPVAGRN